MVATETVGWLSLECMLCWGPVGVKTATCECFVFSGKSSRNIHVLRLPLPPHTGQMACQAGSWLNLLGICIFRKPNAKVAFMVFVTLPIRNLSKGLGCKTRFRSSRLHSVVYAARYRRATWLPLVRGTLQVCPKPYLTLI